MYQIIQKDFSHINLLINNIEHGELSLTIKNSIQATGKLIYTESMFSIECTVDFLQHCGSVPLTVNFDNVTYHSDIAFIKSSQEIPCNGSLKSKLTISPERLTISNSPPHCEIGRVVFFPSESYAPHNTFQEYSYQHKNSHLSNLVKVNLLNYNIHVTFYQEDNRNYLVYDFYPPVDNELLPDILFSISLSMALVSGEFLYGNALLFKRINTQPEDYKLIEFRRFKKSISTGNTIIYNNPFSFTNLDRTRAKALHPLLNVLSTKDLSRLTSIIHQSKYIKSAVIYLLDASKASVETMLPIYAVALEAISKDHKIRHHEKSKKLLTKTKSRKLIKSLKKTLQDLVADGTLTSDEGKPIEARISNLIQQPNATSLESVFTENNIYLNEEDKKAIATRNNLLHGDFVSLIKSEAFNEKEIVDHFSIGLRVHFLVARYILTISDYTGYMVNLPVVLRTNSPIILTGGQELEEIFTKNQHIIT